MIATALAGLVLAAVMSITLFSARSFAALTNYVDLDNYSRNALDFMSREIRQADRLLSGNDHQLTFMHTNPTNGMAYTVSYVYSPDSRTLARLESGHRTVLLEECNFLQFDLFQRNPVGGTYDQYPAASPDTCKLIQMRWVCSRDIMQQPVNTESVQSAKVVIRKQ
jgi:hypothetical protein